MVRRGLEALDFKTGSKSWLSSALPAGSLNPEIDAKVAIRSIWLTSAAVVLFGATTPGQRTALYYGRLNDEPNVFIVRSPLVEEISASILTAKP